MSLFHHISLPKIDPLGGGLAEEIIAEQQSEDVITLDESVNEGQLSSFWNSVEEDIAQDPEWFHFSED
ncbi:hypothetical protein D3C87_1558020 [compost metagenome]|jgi:hypothetical protein